MKSKDNRENNFTSNLEIKDNNLKKWMNRLLNYNKNNKFYELENDSDTDENTNSKYKSHVIDFLYNKLSQIK